MSLIDTLIRCRCRLASAISRLRVELAVRPTVPLRCQLNIASFFQHAPRSLELHSFTIKVNAATSLGQNIPLLEQVMRHISLKHKIRLLRLSGFPPSSTPILQWMGSFCRSIRVTDSQGVTMKYSAESRKVTYDVGFQAALMQQLSIDPGRRTSDILTSQVGIENYVRMGCVFEDLVGRGEDTVDAEGDSASEIKHCHRCVVCWISSNSTQLWLCGSCRDMIYCSVACQKM